MNIYMRGSLGWTTLDTTGMYGIAEGLRGFPTEDSVRGHFRELTV